MEYKPWEKVIARSLDYVIGRTDEDEPKVPVLTQRQAKIGLYLRIALQFVNQFFWGFPYQPGFFLSNR